jgi:hypothetical protein
VTKAKKQSRQVTVNVRDGDNYLIPGVHIRWTKNGKAYGEIVSSDGRGSVTVDDPQAVIGVSVEYKNKAEKRSLAIDQSECLIVLNDVHVNASWKKTVERHLPALCGILFIVAAVVLTFSFTKPTVFQTQIIRALFALGGGAFANEISGMIKVDIKFGQQVIIGATGALAVFVLLDLVAPK